MTPAQSSRIERLYARALNLYPPSFRNAYAGPMRQALHDALADPALPRPSLMATLVRDLMTSLFKEHFNMFRETFTRPALLFNAVILAGIASGIALALYAIPQHLLRTGLNDPQIAMATDMAAILDRFGLQEGLRQGALLNNGGVVDMARSLSPFVIVYDDQGRPLASQGQLNGQTPAPPQGVFDYVRQHGEERISWQPILGRDRGVRIAAVVQRVNGPHPGFVLAGRNMREVEGRIADVKQMAGLTWLGMLTVIVLGTALFGWMTRNSADRVASPVS